MDGNAAHQNMGLTAFLCCVYIVAQICDLVKRFFIYFLRVFCDAFLRCVHTELFGPSQLNDLISQDSGIFEFHHPGSLAHFLFQFGNFPFPLHLGHLHSVLASDLRCGLGDFDQIPNRFDDGLGNDAMGFVIGSLDVAPPLCLLEG